MPLIRSSVFPVAGVSEDRISQNGQKSSQIYVRFGLIACVIRWRQQEHSAYVLEFHRELFHWAARRIRPEFQASTWSLFWRTSVEGESIADAARELGLSIGAAYAARCRILARLKKTIEELDDLSDC